MHKKGFILLDKSNKPKKSYLTGFTPTPIIEPKRSRNKLVRGFTLLEILVSALIMALVMSGLAYVFVAGKRHILHGHYRIRAVELGRFFLEPLQMQVRQDEWGSNCLGSSAGCPTSPADDVTIDGITYKPTTVVNQNFSGTTLSKVKITINWTETPP